MDDDIIYHYCSSDSFYSIVDTFTLRLSSMQLSNDHMEGKWALRCFDNYARKSRRSDNQAYIALKCAESVVDNIGVCAFCMSAAKDKLSQWRGYADDGCGFSIGFSKAGLRNMVSSTHNSVFLRQISYTSDDAAESVQPIFEKFLNDIVLDGDISNALSSVGDIVSSFNYPYFQKDIFDDFADTYDRRASVLEMLLSIFSYKNMSFSEEGEWRLIKPSTNGMDIGYFSRRNCIVPFYKFIIDEKSLIRDVYIGPKNITPRNDVRSFLNSRGINCSVHVSTASYR